MRHPIPDGMLETAENLRRLYGIGRREQDQLALSHRCAAVCVVTHPDLCSGSGASATPCSSG